MSERTESRYEEKSYVDHIDAAPHPILATDPAFTKPTEYGENQLKSDLDRLPILKAIATFRKTAFICLIAGFTAATDGRTLLTPSSFS